MASRLRKHTPIKAETELLEPFVGLGMSEIVVPNDMAQMLAALNNLRSLSVLGFDTESKPIWVKGEISDGPHVVQFATPERAYIFQLHRPGCGEVVAKILADANIIKVGFGLKSDRGQIHRKLGVKIRSVLDLNKIFRSDGYRNATGVRAAVAIVFNQRFTKAKKITISNWSLPRLSDRQLIYAANDAYAALKVLIALDRPLASWPLACIAPASEHEGPLDQTFPADKTPKS